MTLAIQVEKKSFDILARRITPFHKKAMVAALRAEGYRLNMRGIKPYARSWGRGSWKPVSPVTPLLRKGRGYGPWVARFSRYYVDAERLTAHVGLLGKLPNARFKPISKGFIASAKRHASGHSIFITGKAQRYMAKKVLDPGAKHFSRLKTAKGAFNKWNRLHKAIPRAGLHRVKPRPFAEPVLAEQRQRSIRNITRLYATKINGLRFDRDWAKTWGNA